MTIGFDLDHDLDLEFSRSHMEFSISRPKWSGCHKKKSKHIDWNQGLKCDHQMWPWPWPRPWIFKVKYGICYLNQKCSDCHEMKSKHIDWTLGLKCDQWVWPWPWLFLIIFLLSIKRYSQSATVKVFLIRHHHNMWPPCPWSWHLNFPGQMWPWPFGDQGQV